MNRKHIASVSKTPERPATPGVEHPNRRAGNPGPGLSPTSSTASEIADKYNRLTRELTLISIIFAVLVALAWALFSGKFVQQEEQPATPSWLRIAKTHFTEDRLTLPADNNALDAFLQARELSLGSSAVDKGIQAISERYLELVNSLALNRDLELAAQTLEAAARVIPHAPGNYAKALAEAGEELQKVRQVVARERESAKTTAETYEPLTVFQDYFQDGSMGPEMVVIPSGRFTIGSPGHERGRDEDEAPQLSISVDRFAMGRTEVTFAEYDQFAKVMGWALPEDSGWGRGLHPATNISWLEAKSYAVWLSEQTGFTYRLPTEAEWEYAARANTTTPYISGECLSPEYANVDFRIGTEQCPSAPINVGKTEPVGSRQPNPWGLHNLYGNVREWVQDCWAFTYSPEITDGTPYFSGEGGKCGANGHRAIRGGSWSSPTQGARTANRYDLAEHDWNPTIGFRLVRELD